ncbi:electron transfer flavoprotein subunit beta/FixA family protein [Desulfobacterales bacterium HSG16]|nr:electron transfer flavoprotein subunit beta/FixA family protein [Desulfobacterales bacterium HSG16]
MLKLVVCIKQVPMVSELPWNSKTGTLRREMAEGMINPACKHALESALVLKQEHNCHITVITMGPPMAEEVLYEAIAMGADCGILLTDPRMAGADTLITSRTLAATIETRCPDFDLILCGCHTSDSETGQVGPQLAENMNIAGAAYIEHMELNGRTLRMKRVVDEFLETLEMDLPGLVTINTRTYIPRYVPLDGLQNAFEKQDIKLIDADELGIDPKTIGMKASPTRILDVYSPVEEKKNVVMKGAVKKMVDRLFDEYGDRISAAIGKDLKTHDHDEEQT